MCQHDESFKLLQTAHVVTHANDALITLDTYIGDDLLAMTQANLRLAFLT